MSDIEDFEAGIVALSVRKVATAAGAQFYGSPIGTPITAAKAAKAIQDGVAAGVQPPLDGIHDDQGQVVPPSQLGYKGGTNVGAGDNALTQGKTRPQYPNVQGKQHVVGKPGASPSDEGDVAPAAAKPLNLKVQKPSISGNQHFKVGEGEFSAPSGSKLIIPSTQPNMAYVVTPDGKVHAFNHEGEVSVPAPLDSILAKKFQGDLTADPKYNETPFDKTGGEMSLDSLKAGDVLNDADGNPAFTKNADGSWKHNGLGADVDEADIQDMYDSGDLTPASTPDVDTTTEALKGKEAQNFKDLKLPEAKQALDGMPAGQVITVGNGKKITKSDGETGVWKSESGEEISSTTLAMLKNQIGVGEEPTAEHDPLDETSKDPLDEGAPEPLGGKASKAWAENAKHGASFDHKGSSGNTTKWKKNAEADTWETGKGSVLPSDKMHGFLGEGKEGTSITNHGADKPGKTDPTKTNPAFQAPKSDKIKADAPEDTQKREAPKAPEPVAEGTDISAENGFHPGDSQFANEAKPEHIEAAKTGDQFLTGQKYDPEDGAPHEATGVLTKHDDGSFVDHETGNHLSPGDVHGFLADPDLSLHAHKDNSHFQKQEEAPKEEPAAEAPKKSDGPKPLSDDEFKRQQKVIAEAGVGSTIQYNNTAKGEVDEYILGHDGIWTSDTNVPHSAEDWDTSLKKGKVTVTDSGSGTPDQQPDTVKDFFAKTLAGVEQTKKEEPKKPKAKVESQKDKFYSGAENPSANEALGKVGEVIDVPKGLTPPTIEVHDHLDSSDGNGQAGGTFHAAGNGIHLSEKDINPEGAVIHEYAHWLDTNVFKGITTGGSAPGSPYFPFWKAVKDSGHFDDLQSTGSKQAYYSNPKEVFARAFTQYIGKKTGYAEAEGQSLHGFKDDKFGPVMDEMDKLFASKGLLKGANKIPEQSADGFLADMEDFSQDQKFYEYLKSKPVSLADDLPDNDGAEVTVWDGSDEGKSFVYDDNTSSFVSADGLSLKWNVMHALAEDSQVYVAGDPLHSTEDAPVDPSHIGEDVPADQALPDTQPKIHHALLSDAGVKKVGGQAGSNEGGLYDLPMDNGSTQRYYVKKAQSPSHGHQEVLANDFYRAAGIDVPDVDYGSDGNLYSKIVKGHHDMDSKLSDDVWKAKVQEGYAVDAWLGNRDVFGMVNDNILTGEDGKPWRIDNGGSLDYRAQGEKKTDWGNEVTELAIFKTGKKAKTFGSMTPEQEYQSAQRVINIPDDKIREMVKDAHEPDSLADKLIARKNDLAAKYPPKVSHNPDTQVLPTDVVPGVPEGSKPINEQLLAQVPEGDKVHSVYKPTGGVMSFVSKGNGKFVDTDPKMGYEWDAGNVAGGQYGLAKMDLYHEAAPKLPAALADFDQPEDLTGKSEEIDALPVGSKVKVGENNFIKWSDGYWHSETGNGIASADDLAVASKVTVVQKAAATAPALKDDAPLAMPDSLPDGNSPKYSVGDAVKGAEQLNHQTVGTVLRYDKKDGSSTLYTKLDNGMWLTPYGNQMAPEQLNANFKVHEMPATAQVETSVPLPGLNQRIDDLDIMDALPSGSLVKSAGSEHNHGLWLTKKDDGTWSDDHGVPYSVDDMMNDLNDPSGGLYFVHAGAPTQDLSEGMKVNDPNVAHYAPEGTELRMSTADGGLVEIVKKVDRKWQGTTANPGDVWSAAEVSMFIKEGNAGVASKDEPKLPEALKDFDKTPKAETGGEMSPAEYKKSLDDYLAQGMLDQKNYDAAWNDYKASKGIVTGGPVSDVEAANYEKLDAASNSTDLDVQIGDGGPAVSKADIVEAVKALEAHSGFQISYGLKGAPENPITKDKDLQDAIKAEASKAFPDAKPKAAMVSYLKSKLGIETGTVQSAESDQPKINFGNWQDPKKKSVQGLDGGSFTAQEVQDAIAHLEAFQGKAFKSYLDKQNSPLAALDPNQLVGLYKDKTEGKQAFIDLLKTKLDLHQKEHVVMAPGTKVNSIDELKSHPVGSVISYASGNGSTTFYTKESDNLWSYDGGFGWQASDITGTYQTKNAIEAGQIDLYSLPDSVPDYAKVPNAVQAIEAANAEDAAEEFDADSWTASGANTGTVMTSPSGNLSATKQLDGSWLSVSGPDGKPTYESYGTINQMVKSGKLVPKPKTGLMYSQHGILPGKYSTPAGKAYMIVKSDGSGVHVASTGTVSALKAEKVKAQYDSGMKVYGGLPKEFPDVTKKEAKKASTGPKVKQGPVELTEGTFYLGSADKHNATVYKVSSTGVSIHKGGDVDYDANQEVSLDKLKTNYWGAKIVDKDGNSVVPKDYSGPVIVLNQPTTTIALAKVVQDFKDGKYDGKLFLSNDVQKALAKDGVAVPVNKLLAKANTATGLNIYSYYLTAGYTNDTYTPVHEHAKQQFLEAAEDVLKNADTSIPEGGAAHLFTWDAGGGAALPESLVTYDFSWNYYDANEKASAVKAAFGDGKILVPPTTKNAKANWLTYFSKGNFKAMYALEVDSLADKGKSHPAGYLHPGYESNTSTHTVVWGAAVAGEVPAGKVVDGDWSQVDVSSWSLPEVNNYLIKAQMAHPEWLSDYSKRQWVSSHKSGAKQQVDSLSVQAKNSKEAGSPQVSDTPVWTDDIVPAKSYDYWFDGGVKWPAMDTVTASPYSTTSAWVDDNKDNADFLAHFNAMLEDDGYNPVTPETVQMQTLSHQKEKAVAAWFGNMEAEYQAELLKPVYQKVKKLSGGTHDVWLMKDQFERQYIFKPSDPRRTYRTDMEVASNNLGRAFGFSTPEARIVEFEGQHGSMQNFTDSVADFRGEDGSGIDMSTLSPKQVGQLASEHVLDWALDNDDSHAENILITGNGDLVGIDKGRGLYVYGNWDGASGTHSAHTNNVELVYTKLYDDIRDGKLSQEQVDAAYHAAKRAAKRIQKANDGAVENLVRQGVANRDDWSVPDYMSHFDASKAPKDADELVAAVLARKAGMVDQIEQMWDNIYAASAFSKPEIPEKALGDNHTSGWEEGDAVSLAVDHKAWGHSALHASSAITSGHSLLWSEQDENGHDVVKGQFTLGDISQKKMVEFLHPQAEDLHAAQTGTSSGPAQPTTVPGFPTSDLQTLKKSLTAAGKNITANAIDKNYDQGIIDSYNDTKGKIAGDLEHYDANLEPDADGFVEFPSGIKVSKPALPMYKQALDHYQGQVDQVQEAIDEGSTTDKSGFSLFTPTPYKLAPQKYTSADGSVTFTELTSGKFLKSDGKFVNVGEVPTEVVNGENGWTSNQVNPATTKGGSQVIIKKTLAGDYTGTLGDNGEKVVTANFSTSGHQKSSYGNSSSQYEVHLPTGEVIVFRNDSTTQTALSQKGRLKFTLAADQEASLSRVQNWLESAGLNMDGADEQSAETVYWRNMFHRVVESTGHSGNVASARAALLGKRQELSGKLGEAVTDKNIVEAVGLAMTPEEEHTFWHGLAEQAFGAQRVSDWIDGEGHLPQYQHLDLHDTEKSTGIPVFKRIDVDEKDLQKKGVFIAIGNRGGDDSLLKYIHSGGMSSTEERLRLLGRYKEGISSTADQGTGGANSIFTRVANGSAKKTGALFGSHRVYWNPSVLALTGTYSFTGDSFGNLGYQQNSNQFNPMNALGYEGHSNETMVPDNMSLWDYMEVMVFDNAVKRNQAIQMMKERGIEKIRGLSVEDRLVMRVKLDEALNKAKKQWEK